MTRFRGSRSVIIGRGPPVRNEKLEILREVVAVAYFRKPTCQTRRLGDGFRPTPAIAGRGSYQSLMPAVRDARGGFAVPRKRETLRGVRPSQVSTKTPDYCP